MKTFDLTFRPMDEASAREILTWRYEPPYDIYNEDPDKAGPFVQTLLDPAYAYHTITDEDGELVGYCCFGADARVPGGDYSADALDVGLGMRPDLTGQGHGLDFFTAIFDFAQRAFAPQALRVTVAAFNRRAIRVYEKAGFERRQAFQRSGDGMAFVILVRQSIPPDAR
ncbi:MAG: GNAT family N-acetyltransferase [Anaerolineae bacterium]|nr:GNAT family N-acetyltransferase [Anaerolineae bacterium]